MHKILRGTIVAIMKQTLASVIFMTMTILSQQMHVVFVKKELLATTVRMRNRLKLIVNHCSRVVILSLLLR